MRLYSVVQRYAKPNVDSMKNIISKALELSSALLCWPFSSDVVMLRQISKSVSSS